MKQRMAVASERETRRTEADRDSKDREETSVDHRSSYRKTFTQAAPGDERPLVLEIRSTVAFCCDTKSGDRSHASTQSGFANDREMDSANAERFFRRGATSELRRQTTAEKICSLR